MSKIDAYEVLITLNGLKDLDLGTLEFAVITEPSSHAWDAAGQRMVERESWWPFEPFEVLVVDKNTGREPFGEGRKPGKWGVTTEYFPTFTDAIARLNQLKNGAEREEIGSAPIEIRRRTPEDRLAYLLGKREEMVRDGADPSAIELLDQAVEADRHE